jgi:multidrug efflux pump subunit AcrB
VLYALGISLNSLSLFGLVLAVGIVVDDAIVVVENVERNIGMGLSPTEAAHRTMDEVGGALISIALTARCSCRRRFSPASPGNSSASSP